MIEVRQTHDAGVLELSVNGLIYDIKDNKESIIFDLCHHILTMQTKVKKAQEIINCACRKGDDIRGGMGASKRLWSLKR